MAGSSILIGIDGYVHRWDLIDAECNGTGWIQPVRIVVLGGAVDDPPGLPADLYGGEIWAGAVHHSNLVPLPFRSLQPSKFRLKLADRELEVEGQSIVIEPTGEGRYVKDLPDDFRPSDLA